MFNVNGIKDKNYMFTLADSEKACDTIRRPFMIKPLANSRFNREKLNDETWRHYAKWNVIQQKTNALSCNLYMEYKKPNSSQQRVECQLPVSEGWANGKMLVKATNVYSKMSKF